MTTEHEIKTDEHGNQYIDLTPTWSSILPMWLIIARKAYRGEMGAHGSNRKEKEAASIKSVADFEDQMRRMAEAADKWNAYCKEQPDGKA